MSSERRITLPFGVSTDSTPLVEAMFVPQRYEPNYPYPLLILLHAHGGDEQQMVKSMPALSWRNYVGLGLRGPESIVKRGRTAGYGWGPAFARPDRQEGRLAESESELEAFRRRIRGGTPDAIEIVEDGVFAAVLQARRTLHVHSERLFLVGYGEGAAVAYRLGLTYPERFAGVVALNGWIPAGFRPLGRINACRELRILVVHGEWNTRTPVDLARRTVATLRAAGLKVAFHAYPCAGRLTTPMLADVDNWLIHQCTEQ